MCRIIVELLIIMGAITMCAGGWLHIIGELYREREADKHRRWLDEQEDKCDSSS